MWENALNVYLFSKFAAANIFQVVIVVKLKGQVYRYSFDCGLVTHLLYLVENYFEVLLIFGAL